VVAVVVGDPIWLRSSRLRRIGSWNSGKLRVAEFLCVCLASGVWMSPICGRSIMRAL
jgi:hypothetical protein